MEIYKEFRIDSAHRLTGVGANHPCRNLHGHTYTITVFVKGAVGEESGVVIDFSDLKRVVEPVFDELDHACLNDFPGLENPTSETLVRYLWQRLQPDLPGLSKLEIKETPTCGVVYRGED